MSVRERKKGPRVLIELPRGSAFVGGRAGQPCASSCGPYSPSSSHRPLPVPPPQSSSRARRVVIIGDPRRLYLTLPTVGDLYNPPFSSWWDVKADLGCVGNGVADDTACVQAGLTKLEQSTNLNQRTLYFPAGTYKITSCVAALLPPFSSKTFALTSPTGLS